jgi:cytochrome c oxidase subunit 2
VRRGSILQLVGIAVVAAAIASLIAYFVPWLPRPAGKEADRIRFVYWFTTIICIGVFSAVAAMLTYSVLHFRARPDDDSDGPPIHGHTQLEIVWTAIPAVLVTAISIVSAIVLAQNSKAGDNPLVVKVVAQQFAWQFTYPDGKTYGALTLPKGRHVKLDITAKEGDVIHSFWVPEFSQKQDAVPGEHNSIVITPTRTGTFPVICTELCGLGHAVMRSRAEVMPAKDFLSWAKGQQKKQGGPAPTSGKALFTANACDTCHTFKPAGANKKIGPDLDKLPAEAQRAGQPLQQFIRQSIVDPNAYVEPGYQKNIMPATFGSSLTKAQLDALVEFLSGGKK